MTDTEDKILNASIFLFSQKGYDAVTTKEIAKHAGVSEMTVYRHFEHKRNLFECAFERYNCSPEFKHLFKDKLEGNIEKDLLEISLSYQDVLQKNQKLIWIQFRNGDMTSDFNAPLHKFPRELIRILVDYFTSLKQKDLIKGDPEVLAINFLAANFGLFIMFMVNKKLTKTTDIKDCIHSYVKMFTHGMIQGVGTVTE